MVWWHLEHWVEIIDAKPSLSSPVSITEPPHCVEWMLNSMIYSCSFAMLMILEPSIVTGCVGGGKTVVVVGVLRLANFPLLMCRNLWFLWFPIVAVTMSKALICAY